MNVTYIRGLDEDIKSKLEQAAKEKGLSLNRYICNILTDYALNPTIKATEEKYANLVKDVTALYQSLLTTTREQLGENTHLMREIQEMLSKDE